MPEEHHEELKTLYEWKAPLRTFRRRDKKYFTNLALVFLILFLGLIFIKEFFLVAVLVALLFVAYASSTIEPEVFEHHITTQGISVGGRTYYWKDLREFW